MKRLILIVAILFLVSLLYFNVKTTNDANHDDKNNMYIIEGLSYKYNNIDISYPSVSGLQSTHIQEQVNDLLKKEALRELDDDFEKENLFLNVEYEIIYQDNNYISVKYTGMVNVKEAAYPRSIFTTININLKEGIRLTLGDLVNIDYDFIKVIRQSLQSYIERKPEWGIVYKDKLEHNDDYFTDLFIHSDSELLMDCFSYFTVNHLGISFATAHAAGDHFEIEIDIRDILKYLLINFDGVN